MKYLLALNNIPGKTCNENPPGARLQEERACRGQQVPPCASSPLAKDDSGYQICFSFLPSPLVILLRFHMLQPQSIAATAERAGGKHNPNEDQDSCLETSSTYRTPRRAELVVCEHL